jgi:predicted Fe-Mo cluster-binding NifX family protein
MKIAIPVKMNKENPAIAPLFGKAKWFAIVENNNISIQANPVEGGQNVVHWLASLKVDVLIIQEMGRNPFNTLKNFPSIGVYHSGFKRMLLSESLEKLASNELVQLDDIEFENVISHHEKRHPAHTHH